MNVIAFVGPSGTGKSYRSLFVAKANNADGIIDDGLLISGGKVIAGTSAKKENTRIASVKHALFMPPKLASEMKSAIKKSNIKKLMILGTSEGMALKIAKRLELGAIEKFIHIEEIATEDEMKLANKKRMEDGEHVIPVPTFEVQMDFSGYFLRPLRIFQPNLDSGEKSSAVDKSIVRPTFSYIGDFVISDRVLIQLAINEAMKIDGIRKINNINVRKTNHGAHMDITATVEYGISIPDVCKKAQNTIRKTIESLTSVNVRRVHFLVKNIHVDGE